VVVVGDPHQGILPRERDRIPHPFIVAGSRGYELGRLLEGLGGGREAETIEDEARQEEARRG
jgi:hypothetical protein